MVFFCLILEQKCIRLVCEYIVLETRSDTGNDLFGQVSEQRFLSGRKERLYMGISSPHSMEMMLLPLPVSMETTACFSDIGEHKCEKYRTGNSERSETKIGSTPPPLAFSLMHHSAGSGPFRLLSFKHTPKRKCCSFCLFVFLKNLPSS